MIVDRAPYSYRNDVDVPDFPDTGPVLFVDGQCALCSRWARIITSRDRNDTMRLCPVQTPLGRAILIHFGLDADDPSSWLFLEDGKAFYSIEGVAAAARHLRGWPRWLAPLLMVPPKPVRDWLYRRVALNRYTVFGRSDLCALPDPKLQAKLIG